MGVPDLIDQRAGRGLRGAGAGQKTEAPVFLYQLLRHRHAAVRLLGDAALEGRQGIRIGAEGIRLQPQP